MKQLRNTQFDSLLINKLIDWAADIRVRGQSHTHTQHNISRSCRCCCWCWITSSLENSKLDRNRRVGDVARNWWQRIWTTTTSRNKYDNGDDGDGGDAIQCMHNMVKSPRKPKPTNSYQNKTQYRREKKKIINCEHRRIFHMFGSSSSSVVAVVVDVRCAADISIAIRFDRAHTTTTYTVYAAAWEHMYWHFSHRYIDPFVVDVC